MTNQPSQQDLDEFFEHFRQLPEYYPLEKVRQLINKPDARMKTSEKINFKPLNLIMMIATFTTGLFALLFWSPESTQKELSDKHTTVFPVVEERNENKPEGKLLAGSEPLKVNRQNPVSTDHTEQQNETYRKAKSASPARPRQNKDQKSLTNNILRKEQDTLGLVKASEKIDSNRFSDEKKRIVVKVPFENLLDGINFIELSQKELSILGITIKENEINYLFKSDNNIVQVMLYNAEGQGVRLFEDSTINGNIHKVVFLSNVYGKQNVMWKGPEDPKDKWEDSYFQEKIQFLIPIVLRKSAYPEILYQDQIFWFEPTDEFFSALPERISSPLKQEYRALTDTQKDAPPAATCTYFEACASKLQLSDLKMYPNPASHTTTIEFVSLEDVPGTISLLNINGDEIKELIPKTTFQANYKNSFKLDLTGISPGMYLISIITANGFKTQRLIIR